MFDTSPKPNWERPDFSNIGLQDVYNEFSFHWGSISNNPGKYDDGSVANDANRAVFKYKASPYAVFKSGIIRVHSSHFREVTLLVY